MYASADGLDWFLTGELSPNTIVSDGSVVIAGGPGREGMDMCDEDYSNCVDSPIWFGTIER